MLRAAISDVLAKATYLTCILLGAFAYSIEDHKRLFVVIVYCTGLGLMWLLFLSVIRTVHFLRLERGLFAPNEAFRFVILFLFMVSCFAWLHSLAGLRMSDGVLSHSLLDAIYFSTTTITTLGYGDFLPIRSMQLLTSIEAVCGLMTVPHLASRIWLIVDVKAGPQDRALFRQLE